MMLPSTDDDSSTEFWGGMRAVTNANFPWNMVGGVGGAGGQYTGPNPVGGGGGGGGYVSAIAGTGMPMTSPRRVSGSSCSGVRVSFATR